MTERLYYTDAYLSQFQARVAERADGGRRVYLDRTAFYPTSGGQPHDLGTLGGVPVADVVDEETRIAHILEAPLPAGADLVNGKVAWERRFDHMQQHTGQHLLSAVLAERFGYHTVSVHFGAELSTLDLDVASMSAETLRKAEDESNAIVFENRPVAVTFEDAAEATQRGLRRPSDRPGMLRVVSIADLDRSACGGTHVRGTGEIGAILLRGVEKVRNTTRVEFVCGARAVRRARTDFQALSSVAASLSAALGDVPALVAARSQQLQESESARRKLEREVAGYRARVLYDAAAVGEDGNRRVVVRDAASMDELRTLAQGILELPRVVFVGALAEPPSVLLATSADSGMDAGATLKRVLAEVGGRGGGSPRMAQGKVESAAAVEGLVGRLGLTASAQSDSP
ncbi:MAG TPA: DHHA1 domain-containing protein [Gemmatimonadaceae bacterium]|nr:DHHA1 domain-containing protein [Gemmatimonadaceae bacterium]